MLFININIMNKNELSKLRDCDPVEYVVRHGEWRLSRGKRLSAKLQTSSSRVLNPVYAFKFAKNELIVREENAKVEKTNNARMKARRQMLLTGQTSLEAALGVQNPMEPPFPGARRVPHTSNWY
jgi:hypothetical protein